MNRSRNYEIIIVCETKMKEWYIEQMCRKKETLGERNRGK